MGAIAYQSPADVYLTVNWRADQGNIKAPRHCPLWEEFTGDQWIILTKGQ